MELLLKNVVFRWPSEPKPLLDRVNLRFRSGQTSCLIGPNGSGKSTLTELALGWKKPESGQVLIGGEDLAGIPSRTRGQRMALVPQEERLPFASNVLDYILLGRAPWLGPLSRPSAADRKIAINALKRTGIDFLARRPLSSLSGGEKRMVLLARSLTQNTRIVLLDEPANHLDPASRERVIGILEELKQDGITLIICSHEPDMVTRLADKVILLKKGREPETGTAQQMIVPGKLKELYGVDAKITECGGRRIILWGIAGN